jgi:hypothetical protein
MIFQCEIGSCFVDHLGEISLAPSSRLGEIVNPARRLAAPFGDHSAVDGELFVRSRDECGIH